MDLSNVFPPDCIRLDVDLPDKDSVFTYLGECFFNCGILTDPKAYLDTVRFGKRSRKPVCHRESPSLTVSVRR